MTLAAPSDAREHRFLGVAGAYLGRARSKLSLRHKRMPLGPPNGVWYIHFLIETKKSESDKMCKIEVVVITYKNITYYNTSGLK